MKCIENEIPFEVPEGWEWTRLGCITDVIQYGLSNPAQSSGNYRLLRITDIQNGRVNWKCVPFTYTENPEQYLLHRNDIVFARTGATVGKSFLITELPYAAVYASYLIRIRLICDISANYIYQFFNSYCYWEQITGKAVGVGQPNCNGTSLRELFIPLPPEKEQERIVPIVNKLLNIVNIIFTEREELSDLVQIVKSKILDLAIRGKLVSQDPNDEPASALLERIRAEKEELIKQGKIRQDKKESIIFRGDDNSYYEQDDSSVWDQANEELFNLPHGWEYARLKDITIKLVDGSHNPPKGEDYQTKYIMASSRNINYDTIVDLNNVRYISKEQFEKENVRTNISENDILLTTVGTLGRSCIYQNVPPNLCLQRSVTVITPLVIIPQYLKLFFDSPRFQKLINRDATGTAQKGFYLNQLENVLVPIPPLNEQYAVTSYVSKLIDQLNNIMNVVRE